MRIDDIIAQIDHRTKTVNRKAEILGWVRSIAVAVVITLLVINFVFLFVRVDGVSMTNTLQNGDRMFVDRLVYVFAEPERGDVIILNFPNRDKSERFVKRVIGVAGDTVAVKGGRVVLNGQPLSESYIRCGDGGTKYEYSEITVPDGCVFVMGDIRNDSTDSHIIGPIPKKLIIGKALFVIWPIAHWESVE